MHNTGRTAQVSEPATGLNVQRRVYGAIRRWAGTVCKHRVIDSSGLGGKNNTQSTIIILKPNVKLLCVESETCFGWHPGTKGAGIR